MMNNLKQLREKHDTSIIIQLIKQDPLKKKILFVSCKK